MPTGDVPTFNPEEGERGENGKKVVRFLEKLDTAGTFAEDDKREQFLKNLSYEDFRDLLMRINGLVRNIPLKKREIAVEHMVLQTPYFIFDTPEIQDKELLLKETFVQAQKTDDLETAALLLGLGITAIHPFSDGNGRTAALSFSLLYHGYDGSPEAQSRLLDVIGEHGEKKLTIFPGAIVNELINKQKELMGLGEMGNPVLAEYEFVADETFPEGIAPEKKGKFIDMVENGFHNFALFAICDYLLATGKIGSKYFRKVPDESHHIMDSSGGVTRDPEHETEIIIPLSTIINELSDVAIDEILEYHAQVKREYVRLISDMIINPDKYPFPDQSGHNSFSNFKEYLIHKIKIGNRGYFKKS